jgi:hypothetical protein
MTGPCAGILGVTLVLDAIYGKEGRTLEHLFFVTLRSFAQNHEERAMEPDELARTVIERRPHRSAEKPVKLVGLRQRGDGKGGDVRVENTRGR